MPSPIESNNYKSLPGGRASLTYARAVLAACLLLFAKIASGQSAIPLFKPGAIRVLTISGRNNHDWRTTTPFMRDILNRTGRFDVRVNEEPSGMTAQTLGAYDCVLLDYNGPRWGESAEAALQQFVAGGKGLVVVHGASWAFSGLPVLGDGHVRTSILEAPWPEYARMIGGTWSEGAPKTGHGERHTFAVKFTDRNHPIARGMPAEFPATDELYHHMRMQPGARILATAFDAPDFGGTGRDEPVLWTVNWGSGRVFHTTLGHDVAAMREPGFCTTLARGVEWAATANVTLPPQPAPERRADALRVRIVTGGHDFDASFDSLFEGYDDILPVVWPHPDAFARDFCQDTDVLVLYDMVQGLSDKQKSNLRSFVENGKGLVVLHHAIADYQDWPWWYEEVVGGRYLLQPDAGRPASTYRHDTQLSIRPVGKHPVTDGIGRMHLTDETYKAMWISPAVQVLLQTDHPTSDGPLAWISRFPKSRVIYIQLGHGREAHEHPDYRRLVHQAVLWSAGRK
jgi:type 1 glutamine amidotransferase